MLSSTFPLFSVFDSCVADLPEPPLSDSDCRTNCRDLSDCRDCCPAVRALVHQSHLSDTVGHLSDTVGLSADCWSLDCRTVGLCWNCRNCRNASSAQLRLALLVNCWRTPSDVGEIMQLLSSRAGRSGLKLDLRLGQVEHQCCGGAHLHDSPCPRLPHGGWPMAAGSASRLGSSEPRDKTGPGVYSRIASGQNCCV